MKKLFIRTKLLILVGLSVLGLILFCILTYNTIERLKVNGKLYNKIIQGKDIVADILPPPEYMIESYLVTYEMVNAKTDEELFALIDYFKGLEREYFHRHTYWNDVLESGEIKTNLVEKSFKSAQAFYIKVDAELIPLLQNKDTQRALAIIENEIKPLYNEHRKYIDQVVILANQQNTKIEVEAKSAIQRSYLMLTLLFLGILAFSILFSYYIIRSITHPLKQIVDRIKMLTTGNTREIELIKVLNHDELGELAESMNKVINGLHQTEAFALEIGRGNLDSQYTLLSDKDYLGNALVEMQNNLKINQVEVNRQKQEEEKRKWATEGIARFSELLRQYNNDITKLGYMIVANLIEYLRANQGGLFVLNNDSDTIYFELISAVAYQREKMINKEFYLGEGLVGQCAYEKKYIYLSEIPENYIHITSGLGYANPRYLLVFPCILNDEVFAVIEIASFTPFQQHEIDFTEKLAESIASTISSVRINDKTSKLLHATQVQREELASREEQLRQNLEEMQATQEDLKRQMAENAEIRQNLAKETMLLDSLMDNFYDLIYFKDQQSRFLRVTKSMLDIHKLKSFDQIIGKSDFDFSNREEAQIYFDDEQRVIKTCKPIINQLQKENRIDGVRYTSTSKYPLKDPEGNVIGTFGFTKDITDYKKMETVALEKESEVKSMLDAIGEAAITIECQINGTIIKVNNNYCTLTRQSESQINGQLIENAGIVDKNQYEKIWPQVLLGNTVKDTTEIRINKLNHKLMLIYTPIKNNKGEVTRVLVLAFNLN